MSETGIEPVTDPDDAFGTLASETRVAILRALWNVDGHEASFSELQEAAGVTDSGKFNYHVSQFDGQFVEHTDAGYRLTEAGVRLVGALVGGTYTSRGTTGPVPVDEPCPTCGGALTFEYGDETATVDCESCGRLSTYPVPPGVLADRPRGALPDVVQQYAYATIDRASRGLCPQCDGPTDTSLVTAATTADDDSTPPRALDDIPMARSECRRCGHTVDTTARIHLARHPAVVAFLHDHGIDYRDRSVWRLGDVTETSARVTGRDPLRARVTYVEGGEELAVTVDDALSVVATDRRPA